MIATTIDWGSRSLTESQAELIRQAFGDCTAAYECKSAADMVAEFTAWNDMTIGEYVNMLHRVEEVHNDRDLGSIDNGERHAKTCREIEERMSRIRSRLTELGLNVDG